MPISLALIADITPLEKRQTAIGTFLGIALLGQSLSMGIGGTIAYFVSWRGVFLINAALSAAITLLLMITSRKFSGQLSTNPDSKLFAPYISLLGHLPSFKAYLIIFFEGFLIFGVFAHIGAYISQTFDLNYLSIGLIMTLFGIGSIAAGRLFEKMAAITGRKRLIGIGLSVGSLAEIAIAVLSANIIFTAIGIFALGIGTMLAHSTLITLATEFAQRARGVAMSLVAFSLMVGGAIGTSIGGPLITAFGYKGFFLTFGMILLAMSLTVPIAIAEKKVATEGATS